MQDLDQLGDTGWQGEAGRRLDRLWERTKGHVCQCRSCGGRLDNTRDFLSRAHQYPSPDHYSCTPLRHHAQHVVTCTAPAFPKCRLGTITESQYAGADVQRAVVLVRPSRMDKERRACESALVEAGRLRAAADRLKWGRSALERRSRHRHTGRLCKEGQVQHDHE